MAVAHGETQQLLPFVLDLGALLVHNRLKARKLFPAGCEDYRSVFSVQVGVVQS